MEERSDWIMRITGVDVERSLIRAERHGHLAIQTAISSRTADDVEG